MAKEETARVAKGIHGNKLYQLRARQALPILVRQAKAQQTISYSSLAHELGMPNPRNLNYVLGCIGDALSNLGKKIPGNIPPIQIIVINKSTGMPGDGAGSFILNDFKNLTLKQKRQAVDASLQDLYRYRSWDDILAELGLEPATHVVHENLIKHAENFCGGGESGDHKRLKEKIAGNPELAGLSKQAKLLGIEHRLPSGDTVDILFEDGIVLIAVEVKSHISPEADITRGLFQCVKYQAVLEATLAAVSKPQNVRAILAIGRDFPPNLVSSQNTLGIEVVRIQSSINK